MRRIASIQVSSIIPFQSAGCTGSSATDAWSVAPQLKDCRNNTMLHMMPASCLGAWPVLLLGWPSAPCFSYRLQVLLEITRPSMSVIFAVMPRMGPGCSWPAPLVLHMECAPPEPGESESKTPKSSQEFLRRPLQSWASCLGGHGPAIAPSGQGLAVGGLQRGPLSCSISFPSDSALTLGNSNA